MIERKRTKKWEGKKNQVDVGGKSGTGCGTECVAATEGQKRPTCVC